MCLTFDHGTSLPLAFNLPADEDQSTQYTYASAGPLILIYILKPVLSCSRNSSVGRALD